LFARNCGNAFISSSLERQFTGDAEPCDQLTHAQISIVLFNSAISIINTVCIHSIPGERVLQVPVATNNVILKQRSSRLGALRGRTGAGTSFSVRLPASRAGPRGVIAGVPRVPLLDGFFTPCFQSTVLQTVRQKSPGTRLACQRVAVRRWLLLTT
jgi:hypothetical protein